MLYQERNNYGVISVDDTFINKLVKDILKPFDGKVWVANYKGRQQNFIIKLGNTESLAEIEVEQRESGVFVRVYIMTRFGVSIGQISKTLINGIYSSLHDDLELEIDNIEIVLTGVISSKGIAKRNAVTMLKEIE